MLAGPCKPGRLLIKARDNVFDYHTVHHTRKIHPTERPIEMTMDILSTFCLPGAQGITPFAGSGNTILAANNLNMSCIGWDLAQYYKDKYTIRVYEKEPGTYTSY